MSTSYITLCAVKESHPNAKTCPQPTLTRTYLSSVAEEAIGLPQSLPDFLVRIAAFRFFSSQKHRCDQATSRVSEAGGVGSPN